MAAGLVIEDPFAGPLCLGTKSALNSSNDKPAGWRLAFTSSFSAFDIV